MPNESKVQRGRCLGCYKHFELGEEVYLRKVHPDLAQPAMFCHDCFVKYLKEELNAGARQWWMEPFHWVYYQLFGVEKTSTYVKPLIQAMTELVVEEFNKPEVKE